MMWRGFLNTFGMNDWNGIYICWSVLGRRVQIKHNNDSNFRTKKNSAGVVTNLSKQPHTWFVTHLPLLHITRIPHPCFRKINYVRTNKMHKILHMRLILLWKTSAMVGIFWNMWNKFPLNPKMHCQFWFKSNLTQHVMHNAAKNL